MVACCHRDRGVVQAVTPFVSQGHPSERRAALDLLRRAVRDVACHERLTALLERDTHHRSMRATQQVQDVFVVSRRDAPRLQDTSGPAPDHEPDGAGDGHRDNEDRELHSGGSIPSRTAAAKPGLPHAPATPPQ